MDISVFDAENAEFMYKVIALLVLVIVLAGLISAPIIINEDDVSKSNRVISILNEHFLVLDYAINKDVKFNDHYDSNMKLRLITFDFGLEVIIHLRDGDYDLIKIQSLMKDNDIDCRFFSNPYN